MTFFYGALGVICIGLVAWAGEQGSSVVVEIHEAGTRPDNVRETIPCLEKQ
jgi:hypothetical protein